MTIKELLVDEETKNKMAQKINDAVDIPMISEKTEGKIAYKLVDMVFKGLLEVVG